MSTKKTKRPAASRNVRVSPDFNEKPDIQKLGRALIAIALRMAEHDNGEKQAISGEKGDGVP